jgi:hypothetical protein
MKTQKSENASKLAAEAERAVWAERAERAAERAALRAKFAAEFAAERESDEDSNKLRTQSKLAAVRRAERE